MADQAFRIEKDSMGEFKVPGDRLFGAQTARAVSNFPISGKGIGPQMIRALGQVKLCAARVNASLGHIDATIGIAIEQAAQEVIDGKLNDHFPVDTFQTGSGTSSNMNANEVIANRSIQILGGTVGSKSPVHPNDHVNFGQSSNDVFPTAIHVATATMVHESLLPALNALHAGLNTKVTEFDDIIKIGRTHLQDATPIRLGQEFSGYAAQVEHGIGHVMSAMPHVQELAQGGTAVGTGINTHPDFGKQMAAALAGLTDIPFTEAANHFEAQAAQDGIVQLSGALKTLASSLMKIANDIRFLGCGPRLGLAELIIPPVQPGSSIMPGKVNPVLCEAMIMACAQVIGNDTAITVGGLYGNFELNVMLPMIAKNILESVEILAGSANAFNEKLLTGLKANETRIESLREQSLSLATSLAPKIGYDAAATLAKESYKTGKTVRELAHEHKVLPEAELKSALDLKKQTSPGIA